MEEQFKIPGAFSWCELITKDVTAAREFYSKLFGWTTEEMGVGDMAYTVVKAGGKAMGGIMVIPAECKTERPAWGTYVTVDDVDATARLAEELGAKILVPPKDIPQIGRFCVLEDPQGAVIAAITYSFSCAGQK